MEKYLIDTNVVSDYFSASLPESGMVLLDTIIDAIPVFSIITQLELLCWDTDEITLENIKSFIADSVVLEINNDVVNACVVIRKEKRLKLPDAIIAATAVVHGLTLVSRNVSDFKNIKGLKTIDPHGL